MSFYTNIHPDYCEIDLNARLLCVFITDNTGLILVHKKIKDPPEALLKLLKLYIGDIIVSVECMHCWYLVADFCKEHTIDFILGHVLYMKVIHSGIAKNDKN